jgi:hypothetical protein
MTIVSRVKRGWADGISYLVLLVVLVLSVPLIAQTPFETRHPDRATTQDSRSSIGEAWFLKDKVISRQASPAPYPDTLILVGSYETPGKARDVWVDYPLAYLASDHIGVEVIDVSDPTNPVLINTIDTPGQAFDIMAQDTLVYVADDYSGFQILNNTGIVGGYDTPRIARGVYVQDSFAYVADYESLIVFDVSNPSAPAYVSSIILDSFGESATRGILVDGAYAYIADEFGDGLPGGLIWIVDVSNPLTPTIAATYKDTAFYFYPYNIDVKDSVAYIANYWNELWIVDVSNPLTPQFLSFATPPSESWGFAWDVKVSGSRAYVANYDGGLWVIDVSDPLSPQTAAIYSTPGLGSGVFVDSPFVYVADYYSLLIFELGPNGIWEEHHQIQTTGPRLMQNEPNPFNLSTEIRYQVSGPSHVSLEVYDVAGRPIRVLVNEKMEAGSHRVVWDGEDVSGADVPSGVYFCRLKVGAFEATRKMTVLR